MADRENDDEDSSSDDEVYRGLVKDCKPMQALPTMFPYHPNAQEERATVQSKRSSSSTTSKKAPTDPKPSDEEDPPAASKLPPGADDRMPSNQEITNLYDYGASKSALRFEFPLFPTRDLDRITGIDRIKAQQKKLC